MLFVSMKSFISAWEKASKGFSNVTPCSPAQSSMSLSARKRSLHSRQSIKGSAKPPRWPDACQVCGFIRIAASNPTLYGLSWTNFFHQAFLMLFFSSTPKGP